MNRLRTACILPSLIAGACAAGPGIPIPPAEPLGALIAEHAQPFTGPVRLAELRDGRVLVHDTRESRLVLVDFAAGAESPVASRGDGPLEYKSGYRLVRAAGDSVWMFDIMRGRVLVFSPDATPVRSFDVTGDGGSAGRITAPWLEGVTPDGWVGRARGFMPATGTGPRPSSFSDSIAVVRVSRDGARHDTVTMLATQRARSASTLGGRQVLSSFDPIDAVAVFGDGRVLVVRGATYTPEIHEREGPVASAEPVVHQRVELTDAQVAQMVDSMQRMMTAMMGPLLAQMPGRPAVPAPEYVAPDPRPASWPVILDESILVDGRDRAWVSVRDSGLTTQGPRFDLLDRDGHFLRAVRLPPAHLLIGFGRDVVYVARRDGDDLLWLGRYPLPH